MGGLGVYTRLRSDLLRLAGDFDRAATSSQILSFYYLSDFGRQPPDASAWEEFVRANEPGSPECDDGALWWTVIEGGAGCAFVPGGGDARDRCASLATEGIAILQTIEHLKDVGDLMEGGGLTLRVPHGPPLASWLELVKATANRAYTLRLRLHHGGELRRLTPPEHEAVNRKRPLDHQTLAFEVFRVPTGIFEASAEMIRIWLDPSAHVSMLGVQSDFDPVLHPVGMVGDSPVVLPDPAVFVEPVKHTHPVPGDGGGAPAPTPNIKPKWDRASRRLRLGEGSSKAFRSTAGGQMGLLDEFERSGWQTEISLPDSFWKTGSSRKNTQDAIYELNKVDKKFRLESRHGYSKVSWSYRVSEDLPDVS